MNGIQVISTGRVQVLESKRQRKLETKRAGRLHWDHIVLKKCIEPRSADSVGLLGWCWKKVGDTGGLMSWRDLYNAA